MVSAAKHYCFTSFKNEKPVFNPTDTVYICWQQETCPDTGSLHWQGFISFKSKKSLRRAKEILVDERAHLEPAQGTPTQCRDYCRKPESAVEGTFEEFGVLPIGKGARNDLRDFVAAFKANPQLDLFEEYPEILAKFPRFVTELKHHIRAASYKPPTIPTGQWSITLSLLLSTEPDRRKVNWYVGANGGEGKSSFAGGWRDPDGNGGYIINGGKHSDIYYGYGYERVVFFDWARDNSESFPYAVVENFKNGYFLSTKYEVRTIYFTPPHVVIFSNFEPDLSKLSEDRWNLTHI